MIMRYAKEGFGEALVDTVASLGAITQQRTGFQSFLANYGNVQPTLTTLQQVYDKTQELKKEIAGLGGREELYLNGMLDAYAMDARIMDGDQVPYKQAIATLLQLDIRPIPQDQYDILANRIAETLGKMGYTGHVSQQIKKYLDDTAIAPELVAKTADRFLERAKQATLQRVIPLPEGDGINGVKDIRNVFWSGYSAYAGNFRGNLTFNIDRPWSIPTFAPILCHEGYPGHQAFYCNWDWQFQQGKFPMEAACYSINANPTNPMFEGCPETGLRFLGWDDPNEDTPEITDEEKRTFMLGRDILDLQRMIMMQGNYLHNVEGASKEDTINHMTSTGFYFRVEAENTFTFITHPVQRHCYPAYYYGHWMIKESFDRVPREKRGQLMHLLYNVPQTTQTLIKEVGELVGDPTFDPLAKW